MPKPEVQWKRGKGISINKPEECSTRAHVKRHRELKHNLIIALTTSEEYTDEEYSASPDTDDSSSENSREATPQYEITDEAPPPETTTISEARAVVHMEDLRRQLNFWHYARKKRQANRNNHRPSPKRGSLKAHRKPSKPSRTPKRSKRPPTKVLSEEITTSSHGKIPRTGARHRSTNKTHTVTTLQQVDRPPIPPQECDPPPSTEHKHYFLCESWILRAKISTLHASILSLIQQKLSNTTRMTEVTKEQPTDRVGSHIIIRLKVSIKAV